HDRHLARRLPLAHATADFVAVEAGHDDVEQQEIRRVLLDTAKRGLAVERDAELVLVPQSLNQDVDIGLDVVDDEDAALGKILHVRPSARRSFSTPAPTGPAHRRRRSPQPALRMLAMPDRRTADAAPRRSPR